MWSTATGLAGRSPQHIGFVVADLDAALADLSSAGGIPVSSPLTLDLGEGDLDLGGPARLRLGFAMLGGLMAEFIAPQEGPNVWSRALRERGPGLHHVAFTEIENYGELVHSLIGSGFEMSAAGQFAEDHWCYLERGPLVIELTSGVGPAGRYDPGISGSPDAQ